MADSTMISVGSRFSTEGLLKAAASITEGVKGAPEVFGRFRVGPAWAKQVAAAVSTIEKASRARDVLASDVSPGAATLDDLVEVAKVQRRDLLTFADAAFPEGPIHAAFTKACPSTGGSVPMLLKSLDGGVGLAQTHAKALRAAGAPNGFASELAKTAVQLRALYRAHTADIRRLTPGIAKLQEAKGKLYGLLKVATRVARRQHIAGAGTFSVAGIARTHRRAKEAAAPPAQPAPAVPAKS
jgi:hypothetical protein